MPEDTIELNYQVAHLSILDEDDQLDDQLEPDIKEDVLQRMHETMLLGRRFDERLLQLQRQGSIGTFAPIFGQEASNVAPVVPLKASDWFIPSFRETGAQLWRGVKLVDILLFVGGYNEGGHVPEESHDLPNAVPVGSQLPHAVGIAYASKLRGEDDVSMVFFGDGATSEGDFHEALNFAGVWQTPTVFICQNNQWAISIPREEQTASKTLAQKALAYGIPGVQVDGNDALAVYEASRRAVERARKGEGPTMIECVTYRLSMHTTADDPTKYRDEEEVEAWEQRDPLPRFQRYLKKKKILTDQDIEKIEEDIARRIDQAWEQARERMAELDQHPEAMFDHHYAERPAYVEKQRGAFVRDLRSRNQHSDEDKGDDDAEE